MVARDRIEKRELAASIIVESIEQTLIDILDGSVSNRDMTWLY